MGQQKNYIVFLCYGYERVFYECTYALLSLSRVYDHGQPDNTEIWIYTDDPGKFRFVGDCNLSLNYRIIDKNTIKQWRGSIDFAHRVKIEALRDLAGKVSGNILYVDTDSVFTQRIDKVLEDINEGKRYMHYMEGFIKDEGNPILRKLNKHLGRRKFAGKPLCELAMWNAGVLGFNTKYASLPDNTLAFTDAEYSGFPKHIIEQFAFSVFFQEEGDVKSAAPYIFHYWKLKEAERVLSSFFEHFKDKNWEELARVSDLIQMHMLMQEKADFFHNRSLAGSLMNQQWKPAIPDWPELLKQL